MRVRLHLTRTHKTARNYRVCRSRSNPGHWLWVQFSFYMCFFCLLLWSYDPTFLFVDCAALMNYQFVRKTCVHARSLAMWGERLHTLAHISKSKWNVGTRSPCSDTSGKMWLPNFFLLFFFKYCFYGGRIFLWTKKWHKFMKIQNLEW